MARMIVVEVRQWSGNDAARKFGWNAIPVEQAVRLRDETFRCPECLGRVTILSASETFVAHGEHRTGHQGCSLGDCFDGVRRIHPNPLN
jgi:hypothetical protein